MDLRLGKNPKSTIKIWGGLFGEKCTLCKCTKSKLFSHLAVSSVTQFLTRCSIRGKKLDRIISNWISTQVRWGGVIVWRDPSLHAFVFLWGCVLCIRLFANFCICAFVVNSGSLRWDCCMEGSQFYFKTLILKQVFNFNNRYIRFPSFHNRHKPNVIFIPV